MKIRSVGFAASLVVASSAMAGTRFQPGAPFSTYPDTTSYGAGGLCSNLSLQEDCFDSGGVWQPLWVGSLCECYIFESGYLAGPQEGDLLFYDVPSSPDDRGPTALVQVAMWGESIKTHVAMCASGVDSRCSYIKHQNAEFELDADDVGLNGLKDGACSLRELGPGVAQLGAGEIYTMPGTYFRPRGATKTAIVDIFATGPDYQLGGFSEHIEKSQCAEFAADSIPLLPEEGRHHVSIPSGLVTTGFYTYCGAGGAADTVCEVSGLLYDAVYDQCSEQKGFLANIGELFGACGDLGNQAVNLFMNRCENDNDGYMTSVHSISGVSGAADLYTQINATLQSCGDGICTAPESKATCQADCGRKKKRGGKGHGAGTGGGGETSGETEVADEVN